MKVKIFQSWDPKHLETEINAWLVKNPQLNTIKIEHLNCPITNVGTTLPSICTVTVIIWYKE